MLALTALIGCGFEHGRLGNTAIDARLDDAVDAPPDTRECTAAWGTPKRLTELNTVGIDNGPWLSDDELTIYFSSDRFGNPTNDWDFFVATRGSIGQPFDAPTLLSAIATNAVERNMSLTPDGKTMFFATDRGGQGTLGGLDIWMVTRDSTSDTFTNANAVPLTVLNSSVNDYFPTISRDGLTIYFSSIRTGGAGNYDIYKSTRVADTGAFGTPTNVGPPISTAAGEAALAFSHDELTLYLQSTRTTSNWDPWVSKRTSTTSGFATPVAIPELSTANVEYIRWISADGQRAYFASTPPNTNNEWDLYVVERTCM